MKRLINKTIIGFIIITAITVIIISPATSNTKKTSTNKVNTKKLLNLYHDAIVDAAVIEPSEIKPLTPVTSDLVLVITWTKNPEFYRESKKIRLIWGDIWVTKVPDVQKKCQEYPLESMDLRVKQLLGLPIETRSKAFVTMCVKLKDLHRTCANPDPTYGEYNDVFIAPISNEHIQWFNEQIQKSYIFPNGRPWTRLGYTYDWNPDTPEFGVEEFVIRKNSIVEVISVVSTIDYCSP